MQQTKIWHVSQGRKFPLKLKEHSILDPELVEIDQADINRLRPEGEILHVFFIQFEKDDFAKQKSDLQDAELLHLYPKLILVPLDDYKRAIDLCTIIPQTHVVNDTIRPHTVMLILDLLLREQYYRWAFLDLTRKLRGHEELFDGLLELSRMELKDSREQNVAYERLLEYEDSRKKFDRRIQEAFDAINRLQDQELLDLLEQFDAMEKLSEYRDRETQDALKTIQATEAVMEFGRNENIDREQVIDALEGVRGLSDKEISELQEENRELRSRLGMPPRD